MQKTVIITGAAGNLGAAVTQEFLNKDHQVIATVSNAKSINSIPVHKNLEVVAINLMNEEETSGFVQQAIAKYKTIDAALLLAGGFAAGNIENTSGTDLMKQYSLNFSTSYFVARPLFAHMMKNNSGRIVFIGSRPALEAKRGKDAMGYALSKSLLFRLAEFLNEEAKGKDVTCTVIAPGTIDTPENRRSMPDANFGTWVKPEQIAALLEIICSEKGLPLRETVLKVYGNG